MKQLTSGKRSVAGMFLRTALHPSGRVAELHLGTSNCCFGSSPAQSPSSPAGTLPPTNGEVPLSCLTDGESNLERVGRDPGSSVLGVSSVTSVRELFFY